MSFARFLANNVQWLGPPRRVCFAAWHAMTPVRDSYSQHGEDRFVAEKLKGIDSAEIAYVDVGANHPTRISNTYWLYRHGCHGVVVEPNLELLALHRRFRPRDLPLGVACGDVSSVVRFEVSSTPVLSRIVTDGDGGPQRGSRVVRTEVVPVLTLDSIAAGLGIGVLPFLSIDTEGHDLQVLRGAEMLLARTRMISVEFQGNDDAAIENFLSRQFNRVAQFGCNWIFENQDPWTASS